MRKRNIKKVIKLLTEKDKLSIEATAKELNISKYEIESIFKLLIRKNLVITASAKTGLTIMTDKNIDYRLLSKNLATITKKPQKKTKQIIRWIGWAIMITSSLLAIIWYLKN